MNDRILAFLFRPSMAIRHDLTVRELARMHNLVSVHTQANSVRSLADARAWVWVYAPAAMVAVQRQFRTCAGSHRHGHPKGPHKLSGDCVICISAMWSKDGRGSAYQGVGIKFLCPACVNLYLGINVDHDDDDYENDHDGYEEDYDDYEEDEEEN